MGIRSLALTFGILLATGLPLAASAGPLPGGTDTDGDTVEDAFDNCIDDSNMNQDDADHDGCGDACDDLLCDLTGDGKQTTPDFIALSIDFGCTLGVGNCPGDCTGDGKTLTPDFIALSIDFGMQTGPSGITNPSRDTAVCH
jgi:hypothetical protein